MILVARGIQRTGALECLPSGFSCSFSTSNTWSCCRSAPCQELPLISSLHSLPPSNINTTPNSVVAARRKCTAGIPSLQVCYPSKSLYTFSSPSYMHLPSRWCSKRRAHLARDRSSPASNHSSHMSITFSWIVSSSASIYSSLLCFHCTYLSPLDLATRCYGRLREPRGSYCRLTLWRGLLGSTRPARRVQHNPILSYHPPNHPYATCLPS
jgi:hypothetical protein